MDIKRLVRCFVPYGIVELRRKYRASRVEAPEEIFENTFYRILENLVRRGVSINTIIDIGASDGRWSNNIMKIFRDSRFFLIEANNFHKEGLENFKKQHDNVDYIIAAAGDKLGEIFFDSSDPFGGVASYEKSQASFIQVPEVTVDYCVNENKLPGPYLLKLDTHGFEVPIFNGATKTLSDTNIIIVEAYNFRIEKDSLLFYEMCEYMNKHGFRCASIVDLMYRPKDRFLWQMDLVFLKDTREEFKDNKY